MIVCLVGNDFAARRTSIGISGIRAVLSADVFHSLHRKSHPVGPGMDLKPIAIMLHLVHPFGPGWRLFGHGRSARVDKAQRHDRAYSRYAMYLVLDEFADGCMYRETG